MARSMTKSGVSVDDWLTDDGLLLLESWARDGYTMTDISNKIGIDNTTIDGTAVDDGMFRLLLEG